MLSTLQPTTRFATKAEYYARYRPSYPTHILDTLEQEWDFSAQNIIVDIGSGTGIGSQMFLDNDNVVHGVEPNTDMRSFAEQWLSSYQNFHSIVGTGEATTLPPAMCDTIVCAQSLHWLDHDSARQEFQRILKPNGFVCIVWNLPERDSAFGQEYEEILLRYGTDYAQIQSDTWTQRKSIEEFFQSSSIQQYEYPNQQFFDAEGLQGRFLSNSFIPDPSHSQYDTMLADIRSLYARHAQKDMIAFRYRTLMYCGRFS
jgi:SAM-dependent methyltransferase